MSESKEPVIEYIIVLANLHAQVLKSHVDALVAVSKASAAAMESIGRALASMADTAAGGRMDSPGVSDAIEVDGEQRYISKSHASVDGDGRITLHPDPRAGRDK